MELEKYKDIVAACNRCGFCTSYCPTYVATGNEAYSPRGRNQMFRAIVEGKVSNAKHAKDSIDTCLLCGECTSVCFSGVPTADLMVHARDHLNKLQGVPAGLKFFLEKILARPKSYYWLLKISFLGKKLGISWVLRKIGILKMISPLLVYADQLMTKVPLKFLKDRSIAKPYLEESFQKEAQIITTARKKGDRLASAKPRAPKVGFLPVCGNQYLRPEIGVSTLKLLKAVGADLMIPEIKCCGLPAASYGVKPSVIQLAQDNIKKLEKYNFETILADDSSCFSHMRDYPTYFNQDADWLRRSQYIVNRMRDLSSFLIQQNLQKKLRAGKWTGGPVAYHDPCKAQYSLKLIDGPRSLLTSIPGLELRAVPDADQCCGGAGTYSFVHPELSQEILKSKIKNIISTGCSVVVTSSASCLVQLNFGLRKAGSKIKAYHISEILAQQV